MADQHPFRIFRPTDSPSWLPHVLSSIEGLFRRVLPTWLRLHDIETADLPTASQENKSGLAYDKTVNRPAYSDGSNWVTLAAYDADVAAYAALTTTGLVVRTGAGTAATRSIAVPAAGLSITNADGVSGNPTLALANDLAALEALSGTGIARRTGSDTWSVGTTVTVAEGGTGAGTFTNNRVLTGNGTSAIVDEANLTFDGSTLAVTGALAVTGNGTFGSGGSGASNATVTLNASSAAAQGGFIFILSDGSPAIAIGDAAGVLGSGTGLLHYVWGSNPHLFYVDGSEIARIDATGLDVAGLSRCNSFRIDQAPTAETPTATHTITISANGTNYKLLCVAA